MFRNCCATLLLLCLPGLWGCTTIKWMYTDKTTGEAWWIKHGPFASDVISYCQPQSGAPVQCFDAELLEASPKAWSPPPVH